MAVAGAYPANTFALEYLLSACRENDLRTIAEIGVGHGTAIPVLADAGLTISGIDRDASWVEVSQAAMTAAGQDPARVSLGDLEDPATYAGLAADGPYDALLGLGILPTAHDEDQALLNAKALVRPGGHVFLEYRNVLFSLVTFNRHTNAFILDDLLAGVAPQLRERTAEYLAPRLDLNRPPVPTSPFPPKYHNPLAVPADFARLGFEDPRVFCFHYHAAPPALEAEDPDLFHEQSMALEHEDSGWKGLFLCSAFLVHARVPE